MDKVDETEVVKASKISFLPEKADDNEADTKNEHGAQVEIVKSGEKSYTKITQLQAQAPGKNASPLLTRESHSTQENRSKRLKEDPRLKHLQLHSRQKAPLLRSSSMPISVDETGESEKSSEGEKSGALLHRKIYRTGSISDYTKQKLKSTILMKTSASLVRKPSITDFEMRQIEGDADSSQSDEEEEEEEKDFKFASTMDDAEVSQYNDPSKGITSDRGCLTSKTESLSSSLPEASVTLSVAITSSV